MKRTLYIKVLGGLGILLACGLLQAFSYYGDYPDKLWLHRCNSIEKWEENDETYPNIEVDVVFRPDGKLDVTHDWETSFGLTLNSYFKKMQHNDSRIWIDLKNLNEDNDNHILALFEEILRQYKIDKKRIILESRDWEALRIFNQHAYYTSYYVDFEHPSELDDEEEDSCIRALQAIIDKKTVRAISFPGWWYDEFKEELDRDIDLLTWKHRTTQLEFFLTPEGYEMLGDKQLKVILLKQKGDFHR